MSTNNPDKVTVQTEPMQLEIVQDDELNDSELEGINGGTAASSPKNKPTPVNSTQQEAKGIIAILIGL